MIPFISNLKTGKQHVERKKLITTKVCLEAGGACDWEEEPEDFQGASVGAGK